VAEEKKIYRCRGKDCGFETGDIPALIEHMITEHEKTREGIEPSLPETPRGHRTVSDYLNCPECYPRFEKAILAHPRFQETLKAQGFVKQEKKKEEGLTI